MSNINLECIRIASFEGKPEAIEALLDQIRQQIGAQIDWCYSCGCGLVHFIGDDDMKEKILHSFRRLFWDSRVYQMCLYTNLGLEQLRSGDRRHLIA